jgi:predicted phosphoribosyltransferase
MFPNVTEEPAYRDKTFVFRDRLHAAKILAEKLQPYADNPDTIVLAIPAGGIPVGYVIATRLSVAFDVIVVRKVQLPWDPEAGFGAVAWKGEVILNRPMIEQLGLSETQIKHAISKASTNVQERVRKFRENRPLPDLQNKKVILADDGLASGFTMLAAVKAVKKEKPKEIIIAVPTAPMGATGLLTKEVNLLIALNIRSGPVFAVADAYKDWHDVSDQEAMMLLKRIWHSQGYEKA